MVKSIQQATGLSLRSIAQFVQIDSGWLSKYERNERSMPAKAVLALVDLHKLAVETIPEKLPAPDEKQKESWALDAKIKKYEAEKLEKKWLQMQAACTAALRLKQLAAVLPDKAALDNRQARWVQEQQHQANEVLKKNGAVPQQQVYIKWQMLLHEAGLLEAAANSK